MLLRSLCVSLLFVPSVVHSAGVGDELFSAVRKNDLQAVRSLLRQGADANTPNAQGTTPLMQAALHAGLPCLKLLLDKGAQPNAPNNFGTTALMWAAGDLAKVRLLVERGANVNAVAKSGRGVLTIAAAYPGNAETVKFLLAKGANPKLPPAASGGPVVAAAIAGDVNILKLLLAVGATADERGSVGSKRGATALIMAGYAGCVDCVRALIDAGADVNAKSAPTQVVRAGLQEIGEITPLLALATKSHVELIAKMLERGADINAKDARGMTPLMMAVSSESQDMASIRLLLDRGATVNVTAKDGQTPMGWARKWGDSAIVKALKGASDPTTDQHPNPPEPKPAGNAREAVQRSLTLLGASNPVFFNKSGCVGCHHQTMSMLAFGAARDRGIQIDDRLMTETTRVAVSVMRSQKELLLQRVHTGGAPMAESILLCALGAQNHPADDFTDAVVHDLAGQQSPDGSWHGLDNRPPLEYSDISETAYAIRSLKLYGLPGRSEEMRQRIARAAAWLSAAKPRHGEEMHMRLLGLHWSGAQPAQLNQFAKEVMASQGPDGGWAQREGFPGDAYATGQALYALTQAAGMSASDPVFRRGADFLIKSQRADGSWYVRSRAVKFQPYFDSGFPYEHDQWISAAGTAWAAMALAQVVESRHSASK